MQWSFLFAHAGAPARGAPLSDLVPATIVAFFAVLVVAWLGVRHRRGTFSLLNKAGALAERSTGMPPWAALPTAVAGGSLLIAVFGYYWDVSWHIDRGRDPGPLANPAHWFIIFGLAGIALAGVISLVLGSERSTGASLRVQDGWHLPIGGILLTICGVVALLGFPLDDVWHRIFGQDVTAWGPTHIQMIGGASLSTLAMWALHVEAGRSRDRASKPTGAVSLVHRFSALGTAGAFLIGLSTLQVEFDFGVPQFRQMYHPVLIMLAAGVALVAARVRGGKGSALGAAFFFLVLRLGLTVLVGPGLGRSTIHFPLYLPEALLVELVALRVPTERQVRFGALSGVAAVLGGLVGGLIGRTLAPAGSPRERLPRWASVAVVVGVLVCLGLPLPVTAHRASADIAVTESPRNGERFVGLDVRLHPTDAADDAQWFNVTSWQGRRNGEGGLQLTTLENVGPGHYRTTEPVPADGTWKTLLRLQRGNAIEALPVFLPADPEIPAKGVDARGQLTRSFVPDKQVLQREAIGGSAGLERLAYGLLLLVAGLWVGSLTWGLRRLELPTEGHRVGDGVAVPVVVEVGEHVDAVT
jgi:hypothetical protein